MADSFHPWPVVRVVSVMFSAAVLCVGIFIYRDTFRDLAIPAIAAVALVSLISCLLAFVRSRFETVSLDDKTISHTTGILTTKKVIVPYDKVTEAKYSQGILHRIMGVGSLRVDSAGGDGIAISMDGVRTPDLERIIGAINERLHGPEGR